MPARRTISPDIELRACELKSRGHSLRQIARSLGCGKKAVELAVRRTYSLVDATAPWALPKPPALTAGVLATVGRVTPKPRPRPTPRPLPATERDLWADVEQVLARRRDRLWGARFETPVTAPLPVDVAPARPTEVVRQADGWQGLGQARERREPA